MSARGTSTTPMRVALVIGNGTYDDQRFTPLRAPATHDAPRFADVLRDQELCGFHSVDVCLDRSHAEIRRAIGMVCNDRHPSDLVVLYYSGHGMKDDRNNLHLIAKDTEKHIYHATSVDAPWLSRQIDLCTAERVVLILDCCYAGAYQPGGKDGGGKDGGENISLEAAFVGDGTGRMILLASRSTQIARERLKTETEIRPSLFTRYLLEGLTTGHADRDRDGFVGAQELFTYAEECVKSTPGADQTPQFFAQKTEGKQIRLARLKGNGKTAPAFAPFDDESVAFDLIVRSEKYTGARYVLSVGRNLIGRVEEAAVKIAWDTGVSSRHAELLVEETGTVRLIDKGSTNKTWIGRKSVSDVPLAPGHVFRVGSTSLELVHRSGGDRPSGTVPDPRLDASLRRQVPAGPTRRVEETPKKPAKDSST